ARHSHSFPTRRSSDLIHRGEELLRVGSESCRVVALGGGRLTALLGEATEVELDEVGARSVAGQVRQGPDDGNQCRAHEGAARRRSEEHTSELQSRENL